MAAQVEGRCGGDKLAFFNKEPTIETALNFYTKGSFTSNGRNRLKRPRDHRFCLNSWKEDCARNFLCLPTMNTRSEISSRFTNNICLVTQMAWCCFPPIGKRNYHSVQMVFTVTSSNCTVEIARFYEFLFGKQKVNLCTSFHSRSMFHFQNTAIWTSEFSHVAWHQNSNALSLEKKTSPLDFQRYNHFKY